MGKYDTDGSFQDPVIRCCDCQRLIMRGEITNTGCCPQCGARRMKSVMTLSSEEIAKLNELSIDPDFIALFGPIA